MGLAYVLSENGILIQRRSSDQGTSLQVVLHVHRHFGWWLPWQRDIQWYHWYMSRTPSEDLCQGDHFSASSACYKRIAVSVLTNFPLADVRAIGLKFSVVDSLVFHAKLGNANE